MFDHPAIARAVALCEELSLRVPILMAQKKYLGAQSCVADAGSQYGGVVTAGGAMLQVVW
jgi:hypothetical protein